MMRKTVWPIQLRAMRSLRLAWRCALVFAVGSLELARAELITPLSIETLAREADWIVQGKVLSKTTQKDEAGRIYTRVELEVADVWKGNGVGARVTVVHGGGILGERESVVSGQVEYRVGEEVAVFLALNQRGEPVTFGLAQGKFHVWIEGGVKLARNPFHGGRAPSLGSAKQQNERAASQVLTLAGLKGLVQKGTR